MARNELKSNGYFILSPDSPHPAQITSSLTLTIHHSFSLLLRTKLDSNPLGLGPDLLYVLSFSLYFCFVVSHVMLI